LRAARVRARQVGFEVGRPEWQDQEGILRYLHRLKRPTFTTRDLGFFRPRMLHADHCIVVVDSPVLETASLVRRFLRHRRFRTQALRTGCVIRLTARSLAYWQIGQARQQQSDWRD